MRPFKICESRFFLLGSWPPDSLKFLRRLCSPDWRSLLPALFPVSKVAFHSDVEDRNRFISAVVEEQIEQSHADIEPVLGLLEIAGLGSAVHLRGDFIHPGQGVHDDRFRLHLAD